MTVDTTHHIDSSEQDDYHYDYHMFRFIEGPLTFIARSDVHSPDEAHFLTREEKGKLRSLRREDLDLPLFQQAVSHLRESGKTSINWLADCGYEPV